MLIKKAFLPLILLLAVMTSGCGLSPSTVKLSPTPSYSPSSEPTTKISPRRTRTPKTKVDEKLKKETKKRVTRKKRRKGFKNWF